MRAFSHGFTINPAFKPHSMSLYSSIVDGEVVDAADETNEIQSNMVMEEPVAANKGNKKAVGGHSKEGLLSPFVILMKEVLGEKDLNKLRGKVIGLHSEVIGKFVETADSGVGELALRALFELADENKNGTIEEEELKKALGTLGFRHLKEKQISGIFSRADSDGDGSLDYEEWKKEAPKTLRTNLIKLAKQNGGDLGFLA
jgi:hypothetical protein